MKIRKFISLVICLVLILTSATFSGCDRKEGSSILTGGGNTVDFSQLSDGEKLALTGADLATELLRLTVNGNEKENVSVSPLSVMMALAMTANGADGKTLEEMETVLGGASIEELNGILGAYLYGLSSDHKLKLANSIWFRDTLSINQDYLNVCSDYYRAQAYKAPFTEATVDDINGWIRERTDEMIERIVETIDHDTVMFLMNALCFEAEWEDPYDPTDDVTNDAFYGPDSTVESAEYMRSTEYVYIETEHATGFMKDYVGNYRFVGLLPSSDMTVYDYLDSLGEGGLLAELACAQERPVCVSLPKFSYDFETEMSELLEKIGMPTAFDPYTADFSKMTNDDSRLYISRVIHKTHITVDTKGTRAAAATAVVMDTYSAEEVLGDVPAVVLNRPFVYMIIDYTTNIPLFVGVVINP